MIQARSMLFSRKNTSPLLLLTGACYAAAAWLGLRQYLLWQSVNFLLGMVAMIMVTKTDPQRKNSIRYAVASILFALLSCLLPLKTMLFVTIVFAFFFLVDSFVGRINFLPLLVAGLISPFFQNISEVFSFPIRLELTRWSGEILKLFGVDVLVQGSVITCRQQEFNVDTSCMGLKMMITSLLLSAIVLAIYQRRMKRNAGIVVTAVIFLEVFLLNILSNLIRIVCLIQFAILPDSFFHELTGLVCLVAYVVIPSVYSIRWMLRRWGRPAIHINTEIRQLKITTRNALHLIIIVALLISVFRNNLSDNSIFPDKLSLPPVTGYNSEQLTGDVIKLDNGQSIIYLKPIPTFFHPEHHPMICWKGSGYSLEKIKEEVLAEQSVYTAQLCRQQDTLYTAWWYSNGNKHTVSQANFRWDMLRGSPPYSLVNITCASRKSLEAELRTVFATQPFRPLLGIPHRTNGKL